MESDARPLGDFINDIMLEAKANLGEENIFFAQSSSSEFRFFDRRAKSEGVAVKEQWRPIKPRGTGIRFMEYWSAVFEWVCGGARTERVGSAGLVGF